MKRLKLFLSSLVLIVACLIPGSMAFAQSHHVAQSAHVAIPLSNPACYGDGLPHHNPPLSGCDGKDQSICPTQVTEDSKLIGSSDGEGVLGKLYLYYSPTSNCNAWHGAINITHSGCFNVINLADFESGSDNSLYDASGNICKGQWLNVALLGDNTGGCYSAQSQVNDASGNTQNTSTNSFCF